MSFSRRFNRRPARILAGRRRSGPDTDVTDPELDGAPVTASDGTYIDVPINEACNTGAAPAAGSFVLSGTYSLATVSSTAWQSSTVCRLTLDTPVFQQDPDLRLAYTQGANPIQDVAGNLLGNFSNIAVTNSSTVPDVPISEAFWSGGACVHVDDLAPQADDTDVTSIAARVGGVSYTEPAGITAPHYRTDWRAGDGLPCLEGSVADSRKLTCDSLAAAFNGVQTPLFMFAYAIPEASAAARAFIGLGRAGGGNPYARCGLTTTDSIAATRVSPTGETSATTTGTAILAIEGNPEVFAQRFNGTQNQARVGQLGTAQNNSSHTGDYNFDQHSVFVLRRNTITEPNGGKLRAWGGSPTSPTDDEYREIVRWCRLHDLPPGHRMHNIIFPGDSITVGTGGTSALGGYRRGLWDLIAANNYAADIDGTSSGGNWPQRQHNGTAGQNISQIETAIAAELGVTLIDPWLIVLHVGTNNTGSPGYNGATSAAAYRSLLETLHTGAPNAKILVTPLISVDPAVDAARAANTADFNERLAGTGAYSGAGVWDDYETDFPGVIVYSGNSANYWDANYSINNGGAHDTAAFDADGIHPNDVGYARMRDNASRGAWQAIEPIISQW